MKQRPILIVDDEPEIRQTLFDGLSTNGYAIFLAENGEGALRLFDQRPFDLVVLDVKLPDRDGIQLLETMKNRSAETPVIMMSGYGTTQNAIEAMRKGAFDYLLKPFTVDTIKQRIQTALKESVVRAEGGPKMGRARNEGRFAVVVSYHHTRQEDAGTDGGLPAGCREQGHGVDSG